jgi:hypothetical protein
MADFRTIVANKVRSYLSFQVDFLIMFKTLAFLNIALFIF